MTQKQLKQFIAATLAEPSTKKFQGGEKISYSNRTGIVSASINTQALIEFDDKKDKYPTWIKNEDLVRL